MNLFAKHIFIYELLNVSVLSNRATARALFNQEIKNSYAISFNIDFKNIEFASRSFLDELNYHLSTKKFCSINKLHMNDQVTRMNELVQRKSHKNEFERLNNDSATEFVTL